MSALIRRFAAAHPLKIPVAGEMELTVSSIPEIFGSMVFNDGVMKKRLPKDTYKAVRRTIECGESLDLGVANIVANAMKDWAIEKGRDPIIPIGSSR